MTNGRFRGNATVIMSACHVLMDLEGFGKRDGIHEFGRRASPAPRTSVPNRHQKRVLSRYRIKKFVQRSIIRLR